MQLYFFETLKLKKKKKRSPAVWSPQAGCAMFTVQAWATEPFCLFLTHVVLWILVTFHSMQSL